MALVSHQGVSLFNRYYRTLWQNYPCTWRRSQRKSVFAEDLAKKIHNVVYIATAEVKDDEMRRTGPGASDTAPAPLEDHRIPFSSADRAVADLNGKAGYCFYRLHHPVHHQHAFVRGNNDEFRIHARKRNPLKTRRKECRRPAILVRRTRLRIQIAMINSIYY